ncbi:hypothetical protein GCM10009730_62450 [Streptomyces albidochromogenes]|uniref:hypothetical protein n=1 Tax=Streptomyces albidochromogenes TaxID=329524 RepID=UPI00110F7D76|nr:hypothetical protein [Streptomyces albidochromogenes]
MASPDSEFLTRASEAAFELGADGFRMSAVTITSRQIAFIDMGTASSWPPPAGGWPNCWAGTRSRRHRPAGGTADHCNRRATRPTQ